MSSSALTCAGLRFGGASSRYSAVADGHGQDYLGSYEPDGQKSWSPATLHVGRQHTLQHQCSHLSASISSVAEACRQRPYIPASRTMQELSCRQSGVQRTHACPSIQQLGQHHGREHHDVRGRHAVYLELVEGAVSERQSIASLGQRGRPVHGRWGRRHASL